MLCFQFPECNSRHQTIVMHSNTPTTSTTHGSHDDLTHPQLCHPPSCCDAGLSRIPRSGYHGVGAQAAQEPWTHSLVPCCCSLDPGPCLQQVHIGSLEVCDISLSSTQMTRSSLLTFFNNCVDQPALTGIVFGSFGVGGGFVQLLLVGLWLLLLLLSALRWSVGRRHGRGVIGLK